MRSSSIEKALCHIETKMLLQEVLEHCRRRVEWTSTVCRVQNQGCESMLRLERRVSLWKLYRKLLITDKRRSVRL